MKQHRRAWSVLVAVLIALSAGGSIQQAQQSAAPAAKPAPAGSAPVFEYDPTWPKRPLPDNGIFGAVLSVAVDARDRVWVMHWPHWIRFDPKTNEAFVSDGYNNRRVIVLDADTMACKRMWGAYGKPPSDEPMAQRKPGDPPPQQFRLVHCIKRSNDGLP